MLLSATYRRRLSRSLEGCKFKLSGGLDLFEEGFCLDFFGFLISLPFLDRWRYEPHEIMERWGIALYERSLYLCWGRHSKFLRFPWDWEHVKCEVRRPDGSWVPHVASYDNKEPDGRWTETYDYTYTLRSGEVQRRKATVYVERREWRWRAFTWLPWPALKRQSIDIAFDDEVGEGTGSWKGGTIGCGWDLLPGETPLESLRRMERERTFGR